MKRIVIAALVVLAGCTSAPGGGAATPGGQAAASVPAGGQVTAAPTTGSGGTGGGGGGGQVPSYQAGHATATVTVAGQAHSLSGGTCKQTSTVASTFEIVIGGLETPPFLDVVVSDVSTPVHDGDYQGGLSLVTVQVEKDILVVQAKITLKDGLTAGSFSGTSAGNNPREVSGSFTC